MRPISRSPWPRAASRLISRSSSDDSLFGISTLLVSLTNSCQLNGPLRGSLEPALICATSMGPPVRQSWDHPGSTSSGAAASGLAATCPQGERAAVTSRLPCSPGSAFSP